ncbi:efflux RND transporter periplasmic adaptor subunit [Oleisolibacter albus]|uniref:efflux RND transporter periplasmic adaptor subunit n=1 Tax=Oleisolibacter albus TaxID=2171757 RepID=UPI001EFE9DA6|nr:efflux RND transporter periplasmic adaptor subunit [Oleisolibacter albus]
MALTTVALSVAGCGENSQKQAGGPQGPMEVGVVEIQPRRLDVTTELPGRTSAYRVAEVRPQVNGIIQKRLFQEGGLVKAGQQLYQIDPAPYEAALASARAQLAEAEANLKALQAKAERYKDLVKNSTVSRQSYDDAIAAAGQGVAQVAAAKAAIETAQINLDYTKVFSPIGGIIGKSSVTEGALVTANQATALATVQQIDPIYVDINQSTTQLMQLRRDVAEGRIQTVEGRATVTLDVQGQPYGQTGELQFAEVTVDPTTSSVQLRAVFPNPNHELLPGLFVRAKVQQGARENAILVSQRAVTRRPDGGAQVWVVGQDGTVQARPVKTALAAGTDWLITDGLKPGEKVVVDGLQKIRPGVPVKPTPVEGQQAANQTTPPAAAR